MQEILLKIRYFERGLSKSLKKLYNFISFWTQPLLMDKVIKNKRGMELVTSHSSGHQKTPLFVTYYLNKFDDVWSSYWVIPKLTFANLCKSVHDIMNYSTSPYYPFESGNCGKGKNYKNLNTREWKELFRWSRKHFS